MSEKYSYDEFKKLVISYGINSKLSYSKLIEDEELAELLPVNPELFYEKQFEGWQYFESIASVKYQALNQRIHDTHVFDDQYQISEKEFVVIMDFLDHIEEEAEPLSIYAGLKDSVIKKALKVLRGEAVLRSKRA